MELHVEYIKNQTYNAHLANLANVIYRNRVNCLE